ncbi:MAG: hypothetical protein IJ190_13695 [Prevotella sp.]|nr:hypothetical protein [Prevotella sp.]
MKRTLFFISIACLMMAGCGSNNPSSPEEVLKKGIEALHNKNIDDVNRYFDLKDWEAVQRCKAALANESLYRRMPDNLLRVVTTKESSESNSVVITAIVVNRGGKEVKDYFVLDKTPSGRWKIFPNWI